MDTSSSALPYVIELNNNNNNNIINNNNDNAQLSTCPRK